MFLFMFTACFCCMQVAKKTKTQSVIAGLRYQVVNAQMNNF